MPFEEILNLCAINDPNLSLGLTKFIRDHKLSHVKNYNNNKDARMQIRRVNCNAKHEKQLIKATGLHRNIFLKHHPGIFDDALVDVTNAFEIVHNHNGPAYNYILENVESSFEDSRYATMVAVPLYKETRELLTRFVDNFEKWVPDICKDQTVYLNVSIYFTAGGKLHGKGIRNMQIVNGNDLQFRAKIHAKCKNIEKNGFMELLFISIIIRKYKNGDNDTESHEQLLIPTEPEVQIHEYKTKPLKRLTVPQKKRK